MGLYYVPWLAFIFINKAIIHSQESAQNCLLIQINWILCDKAVYTRQRLTVEKLSRLFSCRQQVETFLFQSSFLARDNVDSFLFLLV